MGNYSKLKKVFYTVVGVTAISLLTTGCINVNVMAADSKNPGNSVNPQNVVREVSQENTADSIQVVSEDKKIENNYGPIYFSMAGINEREENFKFEKLTPSELEEIALNENENLRLYGEGNTKYSVYEINVKGNSFFVYNPILSDDEDDGNLYMTTNSNVYKLFPDNERSDDNKASIKRIMDDKGNYLEVDLEYILSNADLTKGQLAVYLPERNILENVDREQQNVLIFYDPDDLFSLVRNCLNVGNGQLWEMVDQENYGCHNTKDSYYRLGKNTIIIQITPQVTTTTTTTTTAPSDDRNGGNGGYTNGDTGNGGYYDNGNGNNGNDNGDNGNGGDIGKQKGNCGHGNDSDGFDEQNPGKGNGKGPSGHGNIKDDGPPPGHDPEKPGNGHKNK